MEDYYDMNNIKESVKDNNILRVLPKDRSCNYENERKDNKIKIKIKRAV